MSKDYVVHQFSNGVPLCRAPASESCTTDLEGYSTTTKCPTCMKYIRGGPEKAKCVVYRFNIYSCSQCPNLALSKWVGAPYRSLYCGQCGEDSVVLDYDQIPEWCPLGEEHEE